jgi:deazaflavin-dependent oxidoreductase (nitroreductase family)
MAAAKRGTLVEWFWKVHPKLYRWSGGRIGGKIMNMPVLLLTTHGRRSGAARTRALMYLPDGERFIVIASFLGEPRHPDWWLNLRAHPQAEVEVGTRRVAVVAREADGGERERLWNAVVARQKDYAEYQQRTTRRIPVVVLEPQG